MILAPLPRALIVGMLIVAGCGADPDPAPPVADVPEQTPRQEFKSCVEDVGFDTKSFSDGTLQVQNTYGLTLADVTFFKTAAAARKFYRQLDVDGEIGTVSVAVLNNVDGARARVIVDCLP